MWVGRDSDNPSRDDLDLIDPDYILKSHEKKSGPTFPPMF